jgi:hypothetical protein
VFVSMSLLCSWLCLLYVTMVYHTPVNAAVCFWHCQGIASRLRRLCRLQTFALSSPVSHDLGVHLFFTQETLYLECT